MMVKLQKHKAYTYKTETGKEIEHYKYMINVPEGALNQLGWSEGQDLSFTIRDNSLVLVPDKSLNSKERGKKRH